MADQEKDKSQPQPQPDQSRELNEGIYDSTNESENYGNTKSYEIDRMQAPDPWPAPPEEND